MDETGEYFSTWMPDLEDWRANPELIQGPPRTSPSPTDISPTINPETDFEQLTTLSENLASTETFSVSSPFAEPHIPKNDSSQNELNFDYNETSNTIPVVLNSALICTTLLV